MIVSFAGHSIVRFGDKIKEIVKDQLLNNISESDIVTCYLGGYGDFDKICAAACRELKKYHKGIEVVYVMPYITLAEQTKVKDMQSYGSYDASIYPPIENVPPKFAILKRNEWMMSNADLIIAYVWHSGGAYKSLQVAKRRKKKIINVYELL